MTISIKLSQDAYQVQMCFFSDTAKTQLVSSRIFTFTQPYAPINDVFSSDVYSHNAVTSSKPLDILSKKHTDITRCFEKWPEFDGYSELQQSTGCQTIAVFDIQDKTHKYLQDGLGDIQQNEEGLVSFFSGAQPKEKGKKRDIWGVFHDHHVNFILKEGSLKVRLLKEGNFTPQETEYLLEKGHPDRLCQLTEFFMNAIKYGQEAKTESDTYVFTHNTGSSDFIANLHGENWRSVAESTVYYTPEYSDVEQQEYYRTMTSVPASEFFNVIPPRVIRDQEEQQFTRLIVQDRLAELPRPASN